VPTFAHNQDYTTQNLKEDMIDDFSTDVYCIRITETFELEMWWLGNYIFNGNCRGASRGEKYGTR
jgi:hypothetical protein